MKNSTTEKFRVLLFSFVHLFFATCERYFETTDASMCERKFLFYWLAIFDGYDQTETAACGRVKVLLVIFIRALSIENVL